MSKELVSGGLGFILGLGASKLLVGAPKFETYAKKVRVKRLAGGWGPALFFDRQFKFSYVITTWQGTKWDADFYVLTLNGDIEAVMSVYYHADLKVYMADVARIGWASMEVYLNNTVKATFPEVTAEDTLVSGFITFRIPT